MNKLLRVIPWLLIAITIIALGSVAGVFDADFKDHHDDFDVQFLRIDKAKSLDKQKLTFTITNYGSIDWRWIEYIVTLKESNQIIYSFDSNNAEWEIKRNSKAEFSIEVPNFKQGIEPTLDIVNLREKTIFRM